jgi:hypothetical protein
VTATIEGVIVSPMNGGMPMPFRFRLIAMLALLVSLPQVVEAKRVALIIANSRYAFANTLGNPAADATLIAASLRRAGFDSVDVKLDLGKSALESELRGFGQKAEGADVAMIYYAGHGIEAGGQNYLIPTDAKLERDRDLDVEATRLDTVLLMGEGARMRIIVLDACRNNPFMASMQRTMRSRAVGRGLAAVEPEGETLVVYAAKAGATAADGEGRNSPFAESLARRITQPGLEISLLFRSVRDDVLVKTGRTQEPFTYGSLSGNSFYFVPGAVASTPTGGTAPALAPTVSNETSEALFWQGTVNANSATAYRDYLKRYPKGTFAGLANENLTRLAKPVTAPPMAVAATRPSSGVFGAGLALPNLGASLAATPGRAPALANGDDAVARFAFTPSPAIRQRSIATFVSTLKSSNPSVGALMEASFSMMDFFAEGDKAIAKYGMTTSNLADAMTVLIDTMRDGANGGVTDPTRAQAQAVRRQMALILLTNPGMADWTDSQKQELSDSMVLNAAFLSFAFDAAKQAGPASLKTYSDGIATTAKTSMGIDLRALKMTDQGYQFSTRN